LKKEGRRTVKVTVARTSKNRTTKTKGDVLGKKADEVE